MKLFKYIIAILVTSSLLSCEKEIEIELKSAEPRLVIDASIGALSACNVRLTMTQDYWDQSQPKGVSGATIILEDEKGNKETLRELDGEGFYVSRMLGNAKSTYTLTVQVEENTYIATEYLPERVPVNSIRLYKLDSGGDIYFYPYLSFYDPAGEDNYYLYRLSINGVMMQGTKYEDDKNSDGKLQEPIIFFDDAENNDEELKVGDHVLVEMQSVGKGAYRFYETISSPGGAQNSNPVSNFSGNVLGMFKTYSSTIMEMTITEEDMK